MKVNKKLLRETLATIKANPEHWDQKYWHCETTHCFAGFVECLLRQVDFKQKVSALTDRDWNNEGRQELIEVLKSNDLNDASRLHHFHLSYNHEVNHRLLPRIALGLEVKQAVALFDDENTIEDLERIVEELCAQEDELTLVLNDWA